ncbi:MAG: GTP-binding protein [Planctomycetota bacterium]
MAKYKTDQIRNIAIVGHGGTGKTTLAEAMLFKTGALNRMGKISEGNTVSDFTGEEKEAGHSMHLALMNVERKEKHINISDCPGYADFIGGAYQGIAVCDSALICVTGTDGIQVQTRKMWELSTGKARVIAVTRLDAPQASFSKVVDQVRSVFGTACTPIAFPAGDDGGESFNGVVSLLTGENLTDEMKEARQTLIENAISSNEDLMMLYLEDQPIPPEDLNKAIANAILTGELVPIVPVAAEKDALGVEALLDVIADLCPSPADIEKPIVRGLETVMVKADASAEFLAQVFRVRSDPHLRRLTFFRVYSGTFNAGESLKSQTSSRGERIQ